MKARRDVRGRRDRIADWKREHEARLVQVILAIVEVNDHRYELAWVKREGPQFRVSDRTTDAFVWCASYDAAHELFISCCEEAGQPTFRSFAAAHGGDS
jgi:hypothetical protein